MTGPSDSDGFEDCESPVNQVTKHAEFPQTLYIDNVVVEMPVVMQKKVPQIQTVLRTVESPPVQFAGRVMDVPVIR